jgi:hypothetical protein
MGHEANNNRIGNFKIQRPKSKERQLKFQPPKFKIPGNFKFQASTGGGNPLAEWAMRL